MCLCASSAVMRVRGKPLVPQRKALRSGWLVASRSSARVLPPHLTRRTIVKHACMRRERAAVLQQELSRLRAPIALAAKLSRGALFPSHPSSALAHDAGSVLGGTDDDTPESVSLFAQVSRLPASLAGDVSVAQSPHGRSVGVSRRKTFSAGEPAGALAGERGLAQTETGVWGMLSAASRRLSPSHPRSLQSEPTLSREFEACVLGSAGEESGGDTWVYDAVGRLLVADGLGRLDRSPGRQQASWLDVRFDHEAPARNVCASEFGERPDDAGGRGGLRTELVSAESAAEEVASGLVTILSALVSPRGSEEQHGDVESELVV